MDVKDIEKAKELIDEIESLNKILKKSTFHGFTFVKKLAFKLFRIESNFVYYTVPQEVEEEIIQVLEKRRVKLQEELTKL